MKLGLQIPSFTWPDGPEAIAPTLRNIVRTAEDAGFSSIWVMDHLFQIRGVGQVDEPMLEGYTALSFIAANTAKAKLGTLVTGVTYRHPGVLIKEVTTLDVLSGGRAILGIGAAWNEREHVGLDIPFPPAGERLSRLEEALQIAHQMWSGNRGAYTGTYYQLAETLNVPGPISKPHPPILVGGGGERRTLRLVAKYADACNVFGGPAEAKHKFDVLRQHCEREGRNYDEIEKTVSFTFDVGRDGEKVRDMVDKLNALADIGVQQAIGGVTAVHTIKPLEIIGREVLPHLSDR